MKLLKQALKAVLEKSGYHIQTLTPERAFHKQEFIKSAQDIYRRHWKQTKEDLAALKKKYENPVFGKVRAWSLMERLAQCVDPSDPSLYCVNQQIHTLQVVEGMEKDGIDDPDLILAGLIHDLGKVLLLTDEEPENIVCLNKPIGSYEKAVGLENCFFQWNHDEFVYSRLKDYIPDHVAWLIRFHSICISESEPYMDEKDRDYTERYLRVFRKYDEGTKSVFNLPKNGINKYRNMIEKTFPNPILF
jgi:hypothetical protein